MTTEKKAPHDGEAKKLKKQKQYPTTADFARINAAALGCLDRIALNFAPGGKMEGREYVTLNPTRPDSSTGSFKINLDTGRWRDFAEDAGASGGDAVSFVSYVLGAAHQSEGLRALADFLGMPVVEGDHPGPGPAAPSFKLSEPKAEEPRPVMPIPAAALASKPTTTPRGEKPSHVWPYKDAAGRLLCEVWRIDPPDGSRKQFLPLTYWGEAGGWQFKAPPEPRPLYGLDRLAARPNDPVLYCEGEKACDAASLLLPGFVCVTTMNGAQSPGKADLSPLAGRALYGWPDFDPAGKQYVETVAGLALAAGAASVELLDLRALAINPLTGEPCPLPKGWDAANAAGRGWTPKSLAACVRWLPPFKDAESATATPEGETQADGDTAAKPEATPAMLESKPHAAGGAAAKAKAPQAHDHHKTAKPGAAAAAMLPEGFELDPDGSTHKRAGLYFVQTKNRKDPETGETLQSIETIWLCNPLRVSALCRNHEGGEWGRVLEFEDRDGRAHRVVVDLSMLAGSGEGLRSLLLGHGLEISTLAEARRRLMDFILHSHPAAKARITHKTGWHDGVFVLPDRTIGPGDGDAVIFSSEAETPAFVCKGSLQEWQDNIARYAVGNAYLVFTISLALSAALLAFVNGEGCIFHLRGKSTATSSSGKTTGQRVGVSVSGAPETLRRWRLTDNSLESLCEAFNDLCLYLDELAQLDPKAAGDAAYLIAHGEGKGRMGRGGEARPVRRWLTIVLSSGEISLEQHMAVAERKHRAGQAVRFIELTADAGHGMGVFADLHGFQGAAQFADHLREAATQYHGTALQAWLEWIVANRAELAAKVRDFKAKYVERALSGMASPEGTVRRVCDKFALVAVAGELGISAGILPWPQGEAVAATSSLFNSWLADRGGAGSQEEGRLIEQVKDFLARHGEARFTDFHRAKQGDDRAPRTVNRAGFVIRYREADGLARDTVEEEDGSSRTPTRSEFFVFREVFRGEICAGFDYRDAEKALVKAGVLIPGNDGRMTVKPRLPGFANPPRVYKLTMDEGAAGAS